MINQIARKDCEQNHVTDVSQVQMILKRCLDEWSRIFETLLHKELRASFFLFVHALHEDATQIYFEQLSGNTYPIEQNDLAVGRRGLKNILEQGCKLHLKGHFDFQLEIAQNIDHYERHLDELTYVAAQTQFIVEFISRTKLSPHCINIKFDENGELNILKVSPYDAFFEWWAEKYHTHNHEVVVSSSIKDLKQVLSTEMNVSYDKLCGFIFEDAEYKISFGVFPCDEFTEKLQQEYGYSKDFLNTFYSGLVVGHHNRAEFIDSVVKTQSPNRFMYRPILKYTIDQKEYFVMGPEKWKESWTQLTTNCIPFGHLPDEWKTFEPLKKLGHKIEDTHDKILEDAAIGILQSRGVIHDRTIKSIRLSDTKQLPIARKKGVGEIDIIFLDETKKILYVAECKHNRSRFDMYSWVSEISKFNTDYEPKLMNKTKWVEANLQLVFKHLELSKAIELPDVEGYVVYPLFIINAPSLYMYNSSFPTVTLHDLILLIQHENRIQLFQAVVNEQLITISPPYFANTDKFIEQIQS